MSASQIVVVIQLLLVPTFLNIPDTENTVSIGHTVKISHLSGNRKQNSRNCQAICFIEMLCAIYILLLLQK